MEQTGWALVWVILVFVTDVTVRILAVIFVPRNRRPTAAMAWLLAIYFIPIVGVLLFLLIGNPRLPRKRRRKQQRINDYIRTASANLKFGTLRPDAPVWFDSMVALNTRLGAMPLANTSAILQALPLAVTLGAALFLGEEVGWRRWLAIAAGFAGVLIVIRPGPEGFSMAAIYVIASVIGAAARDLATRRIRSDVPSIFVSAVTAVVITLVGGVLVVPMGGWQPVQPDVLARLAMASALLLVGYQTLVTAMRTGEISFIAPFRYTSLIWAIAIGFLFFGEVPDFWMTVGVLVIVASGLYTFYRENLRRTKAVAQRSKPESP